MKMTINSIRFRFDLVSGISSAMDYQAALRPILCPTMMMLPLLMMMTAIVALWPPTKI